MSDFFTFSDLHLRPDPSRAVIKPSSVDYPEAFRNTVHSRMRTVGERVWSLDKPTRRIEREPVIAGLNERHRNVGTILNRRFEQICGCLPEKVMATPDQQLLIGAYLSAEYAFEPAALFNLNNVMRMNQDCAPADGLNFILSLRGSARGTCLP